MDDYTATQVGQIKQGDHIVATVDEREPRPVDSLSSMSSRDHRTKHLP